MPRRPLHVFDDRSGYLDRFGLLLLLTTLAVILQGLVDVRDSYVGASAVQSVVGLVLLLAVRASGVRRRYRIALDIFVVLGMAASIALAVIETADPGAIKGVLATAVNPVWVAAALLSPALIVRRLLRHQHVGVATLLGALSAYLLIALGSALVYLNIDAWGSEPFFGESVASTTHIYFSLVTMSTLGYGDLVPATDLGRLLASAEAVIGQVFLVTVVALVVGRMSSERHRSDVGSRT